MQQTRFYIKSFSIDFIFLSLEPYFTPSLIPNPNLALCLALQSMLKAYDFLAKYAVPPNHLNRLHRQNHPLL